MDNIYMLGMTGDCPLPSWTKAHHFLSECGVKSIDLDKNMLAPNILLAGKRPEIDD